MESIMPHSEIRIITSKCLESDGYSSGLTIPLSLFGSPGDMLRLRWHKEERRDLNIGPVRMHF